MPPQPTNWTFGAEHEISDWDATKSLPTGFGRAPDYTIVNSNGIAAQPNVKLYGYGGEFNTPPTDTIAEQVQQLSIIKETYPNCSINYRSNLHLHVRIPGLKDNLELLKRIQFYIHTELQRLITRVAPIPYGRTLAAKKREKRMYVSHHTFLSASVLEKQLNATTPQEFFEAEVPHAPDSRILWHLQPRACVNLRQLIQTDTVEFRHFPGTLDEQELLNCLQWCRDFLERAIAEHPVEPLLNLYIVLGKSKKQPFHFFMPFDERLEIGYQATSGHQATGGFTKAEVKQNIASILAGTFYDDETKRNTSAGSIQDQGARGCDSGGGSTAFKRAVALARGLSW